MAPIVTFILAVLPLLDDAFAAEPAIAGVAAAFATEGAAKALAGVSVEEWLTIAAKVAAGAPAMQRGFAAMHPAFAAFTQAVLGSAAARLHAASDLRAHFNSSPPPIPAYAADGGLIAIPDPDNAKE